MPNSPPTYRDLIDSATQQLFDVSDSPRIDAEVLLQHVTKQPLAWLISYGEAVASADHTLEFNHLTAARTRGEPVAYLVGHKEFWTLDLKVDDTVLIPRADTETLVEAALVILKEIEQPRILDLGTGSGAIALSLAKELPQARVTAVDVSSGALEVAQGNADTHGIKNVSFKLSHWLDALEGETFDLIAANPPYVAPDDPHLQRGDLRFEPQIALACGDNGYSDLKQIIQGAPDYLSCNGGLIVEHGAGQDLTVRELFAQAGFAQIGTHLDINGLPRCTHGQWHEL